MSDHKSGRLARIIVGAASLCLSTAPAAARDEPVGQVTRSTVGQVGQRQTRAEMATGDAPTGRTNTRITNRVQSRIRNRIDRYYDPQVNAASPFAVAGDQARTAGQPPRR